MAAPTIIDGSKHFSTVLHEGTGTGQKVGKFVPFTNNATISKSCRFNYEDTPKLVSAALGTPSSDKIFTFCLLYTSPSPRDVEESRMPSSA